MLGIGNGVRAKFRSLESGMQEFEPISNTWNQEWRSSSQVPKLGIGNGGVRAKFRRYESEMEEFQAKFRRLESELEEFQATFRRLESGMEEFQPSSDTWNRNGGVRANY